MTTLRTTYEAAGAALAKLAEPARKNVEDADTGEIVGSFIMLDGVWRWNTDSSFGWAKDEAEMLEQMKPSILRQREWRAEDAAYKAEVAALPPALRDLRNELDAALRTLDRERARTVHRPDDLRRAEQRVADLDLRYAAAEARMAEAA